MAKGTYLGTYSPAKNRGAHVYWYEGEAQPVEIRIFRAGDKARLLTIRKGGYPTGIEDVDAVLRDHGRA